MVHSTASEMDSWEGENMKAVWFLRAEKTQCRSEGGSSQLENSHEEGLQACSG